MSATVPANESRRLVILRSLGVMGTPSEQLFDDFARLAAIACDTPVAVVTFIDEQGYGLRRKSALKSMKFHDRALFVLTQSCRPTC